MALVDLLDRIRSWDAERIRETLRSSTPDGPQRTNWWLGVVQHTTLHATQPQTPPGDRAQWARFAVLALDTALADGALEAAEVLALVDLTPEQAATIPWDYRTADVDTMRRLRKIRNLVAPATQLTDQIIDPQLHQTLTRWRDVLPTLP